MNSYDIDVYENDPEHVLASLSRTFRKGQLVNVDGYYVDGYNVNGYLSVGILVSPIRELEYGFNKFTCGWNVLINGTLQTSDIHHLTMVPIKI